MTRLRAFFPGPFGPADLAQDPACGARTRRGGDQIEIALGLLVFALLVLVNALFAGGQFALLAVDRYRVEELAGRGAGRARPVLTALRSLSFQLSGAQLGITVSSLVLGYVVEFALGPLLRPLVAGIPGAGPGSIGAITVGLALGLATALQMVFGELAPKNLAIARPMLAAVLFTPPLLLFNTAFKPLILLLNAAANWSLRVLGIEPREELEGVASVEELRGALRRADAEGVLDGVELDLLDRALGLREQTAREALIPRFTVQALRSNASLADLARLARASGFTRFPVFAAAGDEVVGVVNVKSVFAVEASQRERTPVMTAVQPALTVPVSRDLRSLLADMQAKQQPLAVVLDEHGNLAGIVTVEDITEAVVGQTEDEHDRPAQLATAVEEGVYLVSGLIRRSALREATGFVLPTGRFETLAGFLLMLLQRIPVAGDQAGCGGWAFRVLEMDRNRIVRVLVTAPPGQRRLA